MELALEIVAGGEVTKTDGFREGGPALLALS